MHGVDIEVMEAMHLWEMLYVVEGDISRKAAS